MKKAFVWLVVFAVIIAIVYSFTTSREAGESALMQNSANIIADDTRDFGDDGEEGGSVKPGAELIVSESIVSKWVSIDDTKFTREFRADGSITDTHNGTEVLTGSWKAVAKADGAVYIEVLEPGSHGEPLTFKLTKLTPEELELVYMDRGGVLRFTRVK